MRLKKLLDIYSEDSPPAGDVFEQDNLPYFEGIRPILSFYATELIMDNFAENNTSKIKKVL